MKNKKTHNNNQTKTYNMKKMKNKKINMNTYMKTR